MQPAFLTTTFRSFSRDAAAFAEDARVTQALQKAVALVLNVAETSVAILSVLLLKGRRLMQDFTEAYQSVFSNVASC